MQATGKEVNEIMLSETDFEYLAPGFAFKTDGVCGVPRLRIFLLRGKLTLGCNLLAQFVRGINLQYISSLNNLLNRLLQSMLVNIRLIIHRERFSNRLKGRFSTVREHLNALSNYGRINRPSWL